MIREKSAAEREEFARLADEVFATKVKPKLLPEDHGKFVAIDVDSGEFEVDENDYAAGERLRARIPNARMWLERAGFKAAYSLRSPRCI